jgi:hypothetical protein
MCGERADDAKPHAFMNDAVEIVRNAFGRALDTQSVLSR